MGGEKQKLEKRNEKKKLKIKKSINQDHARQKKLTYYYLSAAAITTARFLRVSTGHAWAWLKKA